MTRISLNQGLGAAKAAKQDEFYTQYVDIQKEVEAYVEFDPGTFRGKVVYCRRTYKFDEMDADHVAAWSKGGESSAKNCQMLCVTHNRAKGNR